MTTYICDKEAFLLQQEELQLASDPPLSRQLCLHCLKFIRSNNLHIHQLNKLASLSGFSRIIEPVISIEAAAHSHVEININNWEEAQEHTGWDEEGEDEEADQVKAEVTDAFCLVVEGPHWHYVLLLYYLSLPYQHI